MFLHTGTQHTSVDDIMVKLTMKQSLSLINIICLYSVEIAYKYMFCLIMEIIYLVKIIQRNKKIELKSGKIFSKCKMSPVLTN